MSLKDNYRCEGQMSLFDLDSWFGKMSQGPSVQMVVRTSEPCLRRPSKSKTPMPQFLDLRKNGSLVESSWVTDIALLGEFMTFNISDVRSEENAYVYSLTLKEEQHRDCSLKLNCGEKPLMERKSHLSETLQLSADKRFFLSQKACQGILNRASKRGKALPEVLHNALVRQANLPKESGGGISGCLDSSYYKGCGERNGIEREVIASYTLKVRGGVEVDSRGKKAGKGALVQTELSGTLGVSQDQTLIQSVDNVVAIEGNGTRESHRGDGYKESEKMYTLNTVEQHAVAYGISSQQAVCYDGSTITCPTNGSNPRVGDACHTLTDDSRNYLCIESHPNDSRVKVSEEDICQSLTSRMGTGGGNVPLIAESGAMAYRKTVHPQNAEQGQGWKETDKNDTLNAFDNYENRTPTLVVEAETTRGGGSSRA